MASETDDAIHFGFSSRSEGDMSRSNENRVRAIQRRSEFCRRIGFEYSRVALISPSHSPNIELLTRQGDRLVRTIHLKSPTVQTDFEHYYDGSDGIITTDRDIPIGLVSGDCLPLIVWDTRSFAHGIIHVGLLGALNHMVEGIPRAMDLKPDRWRDLRFHLGPSIGVDNYDLSSSGLWKAISAQVSAAGSDVLSYVQKHRGGLHLDLAEYVYAQLVGMGLDKTQIETHPVGTGSKSGDYFSHHLSRDGTSSPRFMSVVGYKRMDQA